MPKKKERKAKKPRQATQSQIVKVNVKNVMKTAPDFITPQQYLGRNVDMGGMRRALNQPAMYGQPMPIFLPFNDRTAIQGQPQPQVSGSSIAKRPDVLEVETNPEDIDQSRPSFRLNPTLPVTPFSLGSPALSAYSEDSEDLRPYRFEQGHPLSIQTRYGSMLDRPQPVQLRQLDRSEDLVSRQMDQDVRNLPRPVFSDEESYTPAQLAEARRRDAISSGKLASSTALRRGGMVY